MHVYNRVERFRTFCDLLKWAHCCRSGSLIFLNVKFDYTHAVHVRQSFHFQKIIATLKMLENLQISFLQSWKKIWNETLLYNSFWLIKWAKLLSTWSKKTFILVDFLFFFSLKVKKKTRHPPVRTAHCAQAPKSLIKQFLAHFRVTVTIFWSPASSEILELGSFNNLAQLAECPFFSKINPP